MQVKTVATICRYNQARSIISGALLRNLFPEVKVFTYGIEAKTGQNIPHSVAQISKFWGLEKFDRVSTKLNVEEIIGKVDEILAADQLVLDELRKWRFDLSLKKLSDFANQPTLSPIDPTGLEIDDLATELAKVAVLTIRWANSLFSKEPRIRSVLIASQTGKIDVTELALTENEILVDCNIARPSMTNWIESNNLVYFNPRNIAGFNFNSLENLDSIVLTSQYEIDDYERTFLSKEWQEFLIKLSEIRDVVLISHGQRSDVISIPGAILGLCGSFETRLVS